MPDPELSPDRFAELAAAHGGDLRRWPQHLCAEARQRAARDPAAAAVLAEAGRLDALLDGWRVAGPGAVLAQTIMASAPSTPRVRLNRWWAGLGLAGAALAGAFSGAAAIAVAPPPAIQRTAPAAETTALFDDPAGDDW